MSLCKCIEFQVPTDLQFDYVLLFPGLRHLYFCNCCFLITSKDLEAVESQWIQYKNYEMKHKCGANVDEALSRDIGVSSTI